MKYKFNWAQRIFALFNYFPVVAKVFKIKNPAKLIVVRILIIIFVLLKYSLTLSCIM